jgi:hypothetical protein
MNGYIAKPVQIGELAEVLKKFQPSQVGSCKVIGPGI